MIIFLTIVHILVSLFLCTVVLAQHGKSADIAATFGGAQSQTAFGPRGAATLLSKATTWSAVIFMITSFALSVMVRNRGSESGSVMQGVKPAQTAPAQPSATPTPQPQQQQPAEQHPPSR